MRASSLLRIAGGTLLLMVAAGAHAASPPAFDAIYVFGDSYCDVGNLYTVTQGQIPAAPYFNGRFSNGPLWVEHVAGTYGLPMAPSTQGGTDYAFAGAEVLAAVPISVSFAIPSVQDQVDNYLKLHNYKADPNALYIVEGGGNDILDATSGSPTTLGSEISYALLTKIRKLQRAGARNLFVPRLFDVGLLPRAIAQGDPAFATAATAALNKGLDAGLALESFSDDTRLYRIDTYALLESVLKDSSHYGFSDVSTPCLNTLASPPTLCGDASAHYFWDLVHPTVFGHAFFAVLAEQVLNR